MRTAGWTVTAWLAGQVILIAGHVLLIFLYSIVVAPGLPNEAYTEFAQLSGPWYSIVLGGPVFYALGRLLVRKVGPEARTAGLVAWALYSAVDATLVITTTTSIPPLLAAQWLLSQVIKLAAVLLATREPFSGAG